MLTNLVLPTSGKGGVGKTMICSAVAGVAAAGGWRVLLVDCDRSGDLATNLGYGPRSDAGESLAAAVVDGGTPVPLEGVRENLDVIAGGGALDRVESHLTQLALNAKPYQWALEQALAPLAGSYDLVMVDLPPTAGLLHLAAYTAAHYLVIPTMGDQASINGLGAVFERYLEVRRTTNPQLEVLGVVINGIDPRGTATLRDVRAKMEALLGDKVPVLEPPVRQASTAVIHMRDRGQLAGEYEAEAASATPWYRRVRDGAAKGEESTRRYASNAGKLAEDLEQLTNSLLAEFSAAQQRWVAAQHAAAPPAPPPYTPPAPVPGASQEVPR